MRRRRRIKQALFVGLSVAVTVAVLVARKSTPADAEPAVTGSEDSFFSLGNSRKLRQELETTQGELSMIRSQYERADKIIQYSNSYGITAGMAGKVFDASLREGIDPELAFRLVRLESEFNERAVSKVGAIGLTQLMPSTAVLFDKDASRKHLFNGDEIEGEDFSSVSGVATYAGFIRSIR